MNGYGQIGMDRRVLNGIVTLLLALADMADMAAGRSRMVRRMVLVVLVPAESVARDFLSDIAWAFPDPPPEEEDSSANLLHLADSFRALAALLAGLLDTGCFETSRLPKLIGSLVSLLSPAPRPALSAPPAPDTS